MDEPDPYPRSHLFTVRLWVEEVEGGQTEWRGQVQHLLSGEFRSFRDWAGLIVFLEEMLARLSTP